MTTVPSLSVDHKVDAADADDSCRLQPVPFAPPTVPSAVPTVRAAMPLCALISLLLHSLTAGLVWAAVVVFAPQALPVGTVLHVQLTDMPPAIAHPAHEQNTARTKRAHTTPRAATAKPTAAREPAAVGKKPATVEKKNAAAKPSTHARVAIQSSHPQQSGGRQPGGKHVTQHEGRHGEQQSGGKQSGEKHAAQHAAQHGGQPTAPAENASAGSTPAESTHTAVPLGRGVNSPPRYPDLARQRGQEGTCTLLADVNAEGEPTAVRVYISSGHALLDQAALKAVRRWQFRPARKAGEPVAARVLVPVHFHLQ